jgi:multidrug efflux pump subunit AcrB
MWIVRVALRRPYTFVVLALLIVGIGPLTIARTPVDIFPNIDIPVVTIIWNYAGLSAPEMADRIVSNYERALSTAVNDIEHIESQSLRGIAIVKVFFQPGANVNLAMSEITAVSQAQVRQLPPGTLPPFIITYNASSVPVLQLALSGRGLSEQQLFDVAANFLRTQLATVQGASIPWPYGGKQPQIQVDLDPAALKAKGLSPNDVVNAISVQNLILPAGTSKIGSIEYDVDLNGSPKTVAELNDLPIKTVGGTTIYIHDVAHVRNGYPPQTNIVHVDGQRAALTTVQKTGNASTLDIISRIKTAIPRIAPSLPPELEIKPLADQSLFVRASIDGVLREAVVAACLTALMILVFLGSWRSTTIIAVSIPLSILTSIIVLSALGETINIMTLGGLALAVGILVDDATVAIENVNWHLERGKELEPAILDGAQQIAIPAFVSTICICIVFVPMFFLTGVARYLFVPMAEAVVFAMLASYVLSRTLVPTMAKYLLRPHAAGPHGAPAGGNPFVRLQRALDARFQRARAGYRRLLVRCVAGGGPFVAVFLLGCVASLILVRWVGEDFFPSVDSGQFKLHLRATAGTRIEETAALCEHVEDAIREIIPRDEVTTIIDNIGLPYSGINLSYSNSAPIGPADADIIVVLSESHQPTANYMHDLRLKLARSFPGVHFSFIPADIVTQILNFGLPAPIDVQIVGHDPAANRDFASSLGARLAEIPGIVDLHVQQEFNQPVLHLDVDRTRAAETGFTQRDVANNLLISLSGSMQTTPTFWLNPATGVTYSIATQTPQYRIGNLQELGNIPVTGGSARPQVLEALASIRRGTNMAVVSHYNVQPVIDIFGAVQGRDLGGVAREMAPVLADAEKRLPRGSQIIVRGQVETMTSSFVGLVAGLALAIVLVYLLIVVNFQSWLDPFIIISALPAALAGIVWILFLSHTTINVPSLTGAIMCMGVATANSILVVSFAKDEFGKGRPAADASVDAGFTRFRPVLMTALAMIIGMVPMALGAGEGGEQNAPLGRAVIGGLTFATVATLFFVPAVFALLHGRRSARTVGRPPAQGKGR